MSAFLTSLASIGAQYGGAKDEARQEKEARADKVRRMDVEDAYLQLARQGEERSKAATDASIQRGDLIKVGNRLWSVSKAQFVDAPQSDPMADLKEFISKLDPKLKTRAESHARMASKAYVNDPQGYIQDELKYVDDLQKRQETEDATNERARLSREATDARAQKSREATASRQKAGFAEREKLNTSVLKTHGEAMDADARVSRMANDLAQAEKSPDGAGAFDMDLLSHHVALTFGAIKGGMRSKAMIDEHRNAVSLLERAKKMVQSGVRGAQLSPEQRRNFLKLGREAQAAAWDKYNAIKTEVRSPSGGGGEEAAPDDSFDLQPEQQ